MENEERPDKELYIPIQIPDSDDYISGIGQREIFIIAAMSLIAVVIGIALSVLKNTVVGVSMGGAIIAFTIMIIRRDLNNENLLKKLKIYHAFDKVQKKYLYVYKNMYHCSTETEEEDYE